MLSLPVSLLRLWHTVGQKRLFTKNGLTVSGVSKHSFWSDFSVLSLWQLPRHHPLHLPSSDSGKICCGPCLNVIQVTSFFPFSKLHNGLNYVNLRFFPSAKYVALRLFCVVKIRRTAKKYVNLTFNCILWTGLRKSTLFVHDEPRTSALCQVISQVHQRDMRDTFLVTHGN